MLHPEPPAQLRVERGRDIAAGVDIRVGRPQELVGDDAVVDLQAGRHRQLDGGLDTDADHHDVGGNLPAVVQQDTTDRTVGPAEDLGDTGPEPEIDTAGGMQIPVDAGDLVAQHPAQRQRVLLDDGDRAAVLAGGGSGLQADPAGADHHHVLVLLEGREQFVRLIQGPQVPHAGEFGARSGEPAHPGAGGEQQLVVVNGLGRVQLDGLGGRVERDRDAAGPPLDVVLQVPLRLVDDTPSRAASLPSR